MGRFVGAEVLGISFNLGEVWGTFGAGFWYMLSRFLELLTSYLGMLLRSFGGIKKVQST